eukprot:c12658_g1_i1 orf=101-739(+)
MSELGLPISLCCLSTLAMEERPLEGQDREPVKSLYGTTLEHCQQMIDKSLANNTKVKFLKESLEKAGCPVKKKLIQAKECNASFSGGFLPNEGIIVCSNHLILQDEVDQVLIHELIHAYDHCRAANLEWSNCAHHACSEIRAANLSGDCHYKRELLRGYSELRGHHQDCVRRRTMLSVMANPHCSSQAIVKEAIDSVWQICYKDTEPFDRVP